MSLPISFATVTVTRVRPAVIDDHGTGAKDWAHPESEIPVDGCVTWPGPSTEATDRREADLVDRTVLMPAGTDIRSTDGVRHDGDLYEVVGRPVHWVSPTGEMDYLAVELQATEG